MASNSKITGPFNGNAADEIAAEEMMTEFADYLEWDFDRETAQAALKVFKKLGLPAPSGETEFINGSEGGLIFLNRYGLVLRLEEKHHNDAGDVPDTPWVLKPIASIDLGDKAVLAICPGCHVGQSNKNVFFLEDSLHLQKIDFWDDQLSNTGLLPIKMPQFPGGVPIVIDRGAVEALTDQVRTISDELKAAAAENARVVEEAQEELYGSLRAVFAESWGAGKMGEFWALCTRYVKDQKLIAGWNEIEEAYTKTGRAAAVARNYEARLKAGEQVPAAPAPQLK